MSRLTLMLTGLLLASALFASGCPETEEPKTCSPAEASWGYDSAAGTCELKESCDSSLSGDYPSEQACREERGLADAGPGEDADVGPTDGGTEDTAEGTDGGEDTGGDTGGEENDSGDTATDTEPADDTSGMDVAETGPSSDGGGDGGADAAPSCSSQGKTACFSNNDCPSGERCEDISNTSTPLPCCVAGERGMKQAGETCDSSTGQFECESGVCIGGSSGPSRCSTTCQSAEDCPPDMQNCQPVFGSGSSQKWCFPT